MVKGTTTLWLAAGLFVTACAAPSDKIGIRPVGSANQARPASEQIAYARSQLALGSPALALEAFRKAVREQPDNPLAISGIADSYAAMGRNDLARRYYEAALALAPQDPQLLQAVSTPELSVHSHASPSIESASPWLESTVMQSAQASVASPAPTATVTVKLPPARPARAVVTSEVQPHLERLSPGEVALVTTAKPIWQAVVISRTRLSTTVRWLPIRSASSEPSIRLLNAARRQGLAARTRHVLSNQGWRKLAIGDAPRVRATTVVFYPSGHEAAARKLAAQLDCRAVGTTRGNAIVVFLGRDATRAKVRLAGA